MTKRFTAMAVLLLQEQGKLSVRDRARDYLVDCLPAWRTITIHQLLTHTSGIPELQSVCLVGGPGGLRQTKSPPMPALLGAGPGRPGGARPRRDPG